MEGREKKLRCGFFASFTGKKPTKMFFLGGFSLAFWGKFLRVSKRYPQSPFWVEYDVSYLLSKRL